MLINSSSNVSIDEYIKIFNKKFSNFAKKAPCQISYTITPLGLTVKEINLNLTKKFIVDETIDVKVFINQIKTWLLENAYPVMTQVVEYQSSYTVDEMDELIRVKGKTLEEVSREKKVEVETINYRIERLLLLKDQVIIRNLETNEKYLYEMKMPLSLFLKNFRKKWTAQYAFDIFEKNSVLIRELTDVGYNEDLDEPNYNK